MSSLRLYILYEHEMYQNGIDYTTVLLVVWNFSTKHFYEKWINIYIIYSYLFNTKRDIIKNNIKEILEKWLSLDSFTWYDNLSNWSLSNRFFYRVLHKMYAIHFTCVFTRYNCRILFLTDSVILSCCSKITESIKNYILSLHWKNMF